MSSLEIMRHRLWVVLVFGIVVAAIPSVTLRAQTRVLFAPFFADLALAPGKSGETIFFLVNKGDRPLTFSVAVSAVHQGERGECLPVEESPDFLRWAKVPFASFTVEPGERFEIPVRLTIPASAPPGSYTFGLVITSTHVGGEEVNLGARIVGVLFLDVRRSGVSHLRGGKYGEIERFEARQDERGIRFVAFLANRGRYYLEGKGRVLIVEKTAGRKVAELPFGGGLGRVIPGNSAGFSALLTEPLPKGEYVAIAQIDYGGARQTEARLSFSCEGLKLLGGDLLVQKGGEENVPVVLGLQENLVENRIVPGAKRTLSVPVRNDFPLPVVVRAKVRDAAPLDSTRCAEFASVNPEVFEIPPYKTKVVKVAMTFPQSLLSGDKCLELLLVPEKVGEKSLSPELQEISTASVFLVFDNIRGEKVEQAELRNVEIQLAQDESGGLLPRFFVSYQNTGNTRLTPFCRIEVDEVPKEQKGVFLERVGGLLSLRSEASEDLVLPGMEGTVILSASQPIFPGEYRLKISLYQGEKELFLRETTFTIGKK